MNGFEELPWKLILEQVSLTDLIRLRLVNKQWKSLIELVLSEKRELALFIQRSSDPPFYWHYNDQRVNRDYSSTCNAHIYESLWFRRQFRDITNLVIAAPLPCDCFILDQHYLDYGKRNPELGLADLNSFIGQFEKLLHLQIVVERAGAYKLRICSKTLQTLHIIKSNPGLIEGPEFQSLVCENLIEFSVPNYLKINPNSLFPSKLRYLRCRTLDYERGQICFPSLEVLVLERQEKPIHLDDFPRLEKLHFNVVENWPGVFLDVIKARDRCRRPLKIFLSGVHFSFERDDFDDDQSYYKAIHNLYTQLMDLELRTNYIPNVSSRLVSFCKNLYFSLQWSEYVQLYPIPTLDVELLRFYVRCKENFESNRFERTIQYSDSFGQTLEALRRDDPNMYESLLKIGDDLYFLEFTNKERLLSVKDFFEFVCGVNLTLFDQELLDLLPNLIPNLRYLVVHPFNLVDKTGIPMNYNFISKLTSLEAFYVFSKDCPSFNDLREIFRNCKLISIARFSKFRFLKRRSIRGCREVEWNLDKLGFNLIDRTKKFSDINSLLDYCASMPEFSENNHEPSMAFGHLNKLSECFKKLLN